MSNPSSEPLPQRFGPGDISVVIPVRNRAGMLVEAVTSVLSQTHRASEVLVVDDGSSDGTVHRLRRTLGYPPGLRCIMCPPGGVSAARNTGIRAARSPWVAFLDSDDLWHREKLERQQAVIAERCDIGIVHTGERWLRRGTPLAQRARHRKRGGRIFEDCLPLCAISPSSVMIHERVFAAVGAFDTALPACEDYDLWLRITARFPVAYVDAPLVTKRGGHADQLSTRHFGLDRFRIRALTKVLDSSILDAGQRAAARRELARKIGIYGKGLVKRGKVGELAHLQAVRRTFL